MVLEEVRVYWRSANLSECQPGAWLDRRQCCHMVRWDLATSLPVHRMQHNATRPKVDAVRCITMHSDECVVVSFRFITWQDSVFTVSLARIRFLGFCFNSFKLSSFINYHDTRIVSFIQYVTIPKVLKKYISSTGQEILFS